MQKNKLGHVYINFDEASKKEIVKWSSFISGKDLVFSNVGNKIKGGNVTNDLHLTLFFGFDNEKVDKIKLDKYLKGLTLDNIKISKVNMFCLKDCEYSILYLEVDDQNFTLRDINKQLLDFGYIEDANTFNFKPHITIAYVKKDFNIKDINYNGPSVLRIDNLNYKVKSN